jgi:hypothetical protein
MIKTTKTLQSYANEALALSDKDLEGKLKVLGDILEFKFQIPSNIFVSILTMTTKILIHRVPISKDFLVGRLLSILEALLDA